MDSVFLLAVAKGTAVGVDSTETTLSGLCGAGPKKDRRLKQSGNIVFLLRCRCCDDRILPTTVTY